MRPKAYLSSLLLGVFSILYAAEAPTRIATTDGKILTASEVELTPDETIKWKHSKKQNGKLEGTLPLSSIMAIQLPASVENVPPKTLNRTIFPGAWKMPDQYKKAKKVNVSTTSRFETTAVKHENETTTARFTGDLHLPVSGTWTLQAIAPDYLGITIDGQPAITAETPEFTAKVKLEAGKRALALTVPSAKKRIYEVKITGPGFDGDLAKLITGGAPSWTVTLKNGSSITGTRGKRTADTQVITSNTGEITLLWEHVRGIALNSTASKKRLASLPLDEDVVLVSSGERIVELRADIVSVDATHVHVNHNGAERKVSHDRIVAFRRSKMPISRQSTDQATIHLSDGGILHGKVEGLSKERAILLSLPGSKNNPILLKKGLASEVQFTQKGCTFASSLKPTKVDQRAWFDYPVQWRADQGFNHDRPMVEGHVFGHALALHAYTRLELPPREAPSRFLAAVGIERGAPSEASAAVRILIGDRILAEKKALTPSSSLWQVDVPVAANESLTLEVDFGDNEDIGDRVVFGDARFLAKETK